MDCLSNLNKCKAECCRLFLVDPVFLIGKNNIDKTLVIRIDLHPDDVRYYRYHRCTYERGVLRIPNAEYKEINGQIYVYRNCTQLTEDNKCKLHDSGLKPKSCWHLDETSKTNKKYFITPNCVLNEPGGQDVN